MVKLNKQISIGNLLTILAFAASMVWTASQVMYRFESLEQMSSEAYENTLTNEEDVESINVRLAKIETKIDEGFKSIEKLIRKNNK